MKLTRHLGVGILCSMAGWASAQETPVTTFLPYTAEITAKTLHVRSGPSTNYYPVARLVSGTRVQVIGQESGWLAVAPPPGCFSLIAAKFVDRPDGAGGVVNADNVRVRAGSDLSPQNYAIQMKLSRGAKLSVLGPMDAEFLKIEPPPGAKVWLAAEYVRRIVGTADPMTTEAPPSSPEPSTAGAESPTDSPAAAAVESPVKETLATAQNVTVPTELPSGDDDSASSPAPSHTPAPTPAPTTPIGTAVPIESSLRSSVEPIATRPPTAEALEPEVEARQKELEGLDQTLSAEMAKPILNRDLASLLPRYQGMAGQVGDEYIQAYARVRVQQIEAAIEMIEGVRTVGRLRDEVHTVRQAAMTERSSIHYLPVRVDGGFDIEGELRPSAVYESPIGPRRYRIVDPNQSPARTIGYLEVPLNAQVDMSQFFGRRVGVKAHQRTLHSGDVDPLSVFVAAEVTALDSGADGSSRTASVQLPPPSVTPDAPSNWTARVLRD